MKAEKKCPHCKNILLIEEKDIKPLSKKDKAWLIKRKKMGEKIINETKSFFGIETSYKYSKLTREAVKNVLNLKSYGRTKCIICKNTFVIFGGEEKE